MTGYEIAQEINRLEIEISELERGLDVLADELGKDSEAYKIVDEIRKEKAEKLKEKYWREWNDTNLY